MAVDLLALAALLLAPDAPLALAAGQKAVVARLAPAVQADAQAAPLSKRWIPSHLLRQSPREPCAPLPS